MKLGILNFSVLAFTIILSLQTLNYAQTSTPQETITNYFEWNWKTNLWNSPEAKKFVSIEYFSKLEKYIENLTCIYIPAASNDKTQIKIKNLVIKQNLATAIVSLVKENQLISEFEIVLKQENSIWKIDSIEYADKSKTSASNENYTAPTFTAEEISRRILKLITSINKIEQISPKNLEKIIGGKIIFDEENRNRYGYAGKITDSDWFYQIFSLTELNGETSRRLEFSFEKQDDKEDDLAPVCNFTYENFKKELVATGFSVKPFYGEHGRLLYWQFEKENIEVKIKSYKYEKNECVKTLWINILQ